MSSGDVAVRLPVTPCDASPAPLTAPSFERSVSTRPTVGRLQMRGISKRVGASEVAALQNITLDCDPGEVVVVVGASGCGKTAPLNIAAGVARPDAGTATLDGKPIKSPGPDRAMVFQDHGL